jgi:hypothetical protein
MRMPKGIYDRRKRAAKHATKVTCGEDSLSDWMLPDGGNVNLGEPPYRDETPASALDDFCQQVETFWTGFGRRMAEKTREAMHG